MIHKSPILLYYNNFRIGQTDTYYGQKSNEFIKYRFDTKENEQK